MMFHSSISCQTNRSSIGSKVDRSKGKNIHEINNQFPKLEILFYLGFVCCLLQLHEEIKRHGGLHLQ